jgi:DUF917 family protein
MGSTAPLTEENKKKMEELGLTEKKFPQNLVNAVLGWEEYTGKKVDVVVPLEVGGSNMPFPMAVAKKLDKIIVDGDYAGRAVPEIFQISLMVEEVNFCPGVSVDKYGNICIIKDAVNIWVAERLGKYLSQVAFGSTGLAGFPVSGKQLKRLLVRGSVSKAYKVGRVLSSARGGEMTLQEGLEQLVGGRLIFKGKVAAVEPRDEGGYYLGFYTIEGDGEFKGDVLKIFFKNENHIAWKNEKCIVSSPDLICCIEPKQIKPVRNNAIKVGDELEVYAFPCNPVLRKEPILKWLSPRHFGFDLDYVPI